jgi:alpha-glutamyl/putrescinyl thymine pyrophosphorylase clade 1
VNHVPLLKFMEARHKVHLARAAGKPKPWTKDPILQSYRFCNVYRELDTVTTWIREHIREPYADHPNLWFMLAMARQINWPETLQELMTEGAWPAHNYDWKLAWAVMTERQARGEKLYTGAYMLMSRPEPGDPKDKGFFTMRRILQPLWERCALMHQALSERTLQAAHAMLVREHGWGSFLAAQVVCDMKYTKDLENARDWVTWAASGPGSLRGLNVVMGHEPGAAWKESEWLETLQELRDKVNASWTLGPRFHAQDLQNCLCEYYKYTRGSSRSKYQGA